MHATAYFAHTSSGGGHQDPLREHLSLVAERAARYASAFGAASEAHIAGLLHDLGKYGDLFQLRLQGKERGIDHWSAGAWHALTTYRERGVAIALAVQGHHVGLQRASREALAELDPGRKQGCTGPGPKPSGPFEELLGRFRGDGMELRELESSIYDVGEHVGRGATPTAGMLDVRMLFSALTDADFEETEAHFRGAADAGPVSRAPGPGLSSAKVLEVLAEHTERLGRSSSAAAEVLDIRRDLLSACLAAAQREPGLFTVSAPTGSGKTLALLAFALRHAQVNDLRRVVVVIPYLSIIEQTVLSYRQAFEGLHEDWGTNDYLIEDHSLAGFRGKDARGVTPGDEQEEDERRARELAENWDAPIVVTTSVQFLESLFSNRSSACRKLHRLASSVVVLDEVQTLPKKLAIPTLAALSRLVERYGSSVVFSTATQPAFSHLDTHVRRHCAYGWSPREVVPQEMALFHRAKRVEVIWPAPGERLSWRDLARGMTEPKHPQALCIVNLKKHAVLLFDELKATLDSGLFHLSTSMCPLHRQAVLDEVKARLARGEQCVLVSTQCVEAGVDIDFPFVYRAFGPLDSIAQAAGRCNRNGRLKMGRLRVFDPELPPGEHQYPDGSYRQAADVARILLDGSPGRTLDIDSADTFARYYRMLYAVARPQDSHVELQEAIARQDFSEVARLYRVIDQDVVNVLVPYDRDRFADLRERACREGVTRGWAAEARPLTVSLFVPPQDDPAWTYLEPLPLAGRTRSDVWYAYREPQHYDQNVGLVPASSRSCLIG